MRLTTELDKDMVDLINYHLSDRSRDTLACYTGWRHETMKEYNTQGEIDWMISYFYLDFKFDMIIVMQRDNKFSKSLWRILRDTIDKRVKPLRVMSDPSNEAIVEGAKRHGGVWMNDEIFFN